MKIELNDKGSRDYYDEVLYVASYAARFIKNHNKKVYRLTKFFKFFILFIISYLIIVSIFYLMIKKICLISRFNPTEILTSFRLIKKKHRLAKGYIGVFGTN